MHFPTILRSASRLRIVKRICLPYSYLACPWIPFQGCTFHICPHSSVTLQYRNLNLLSIDYGFRPRLRPRLTQSRSALLWKPWIFGREDSPPLSRYSFRHSLFKTLHGSLRYRFFVSSMLLYRWYCYHPTASVLCFSPGHFRRRTSRLVSYYALFECMAASEPTS